MSEESSLNSVETQRTLVVTGDVASLSEADLANLSKTLGNLGLQRDVVDHPVYEPVPVAQRDSMQFGIEHNYAIEDSSNATAENLVTLQRKVYSLWAEEQRCIQETWNSDSPYPDTALNKYYRWVVEEIRGLPAADAAAARQAYEMMAQGQDHGERELVAAMIGALAKVNVQAALPTWERLLSDPHDDVVSAAWEALLAAIAEPDPVPLTLGQLRSLLLSFHSKDL